MFYWTMNTEGKNSRCSHKKLPEPTESYICDKKEWVGWGIFKMNDQADYGKEISNSETNLFSLQKQLSLLLLV